MSLNLIYEQMYTKQAVQKPKINLFEKQFEKIDNTFEINHVNIYIKRGDNIPEIAYRARVIGYQKRGPITVIDASSGDKKLLIKIDKNNSTDVTVIDSNNNIQDEFIVHGMQFKDIDNPDKLSIIKVEEV